MKTRTALLLMFAVACCTTSINARDRKSDSGVIDFCKIDQSHYRKPLTVHAIYADWFETSALMCAESFCAQRRVDTWVEFVEGASGTRKIRKEGAYDVIMKGILAPCGSCGHMGGYTAKFTATDVITAKRIARSYARETMRPEDRKRICGVEEVKKN